jgi:hypothetical protein
MRKKGTRELVRQVDKGAHMLTVQLEIVKSRKQGDEMKKGLYISNRNNWQWTYIKIVDVRFLSVVTTILGDGM